MKCQKCGVNEANTHVKRVINGVSEEYMLCPECAESMGYTNMFGGFPTDFSNFLGSFFSNALPARSHAVRCESCGSTYQDIQNTGMVGCANCYDTFFDELLPTINAIHGNTTHCGSRRAVNANKSAQTSQSEKTLSKEETVAQLKSELEDAVKKQEFEKAAQFRDKIKEMEG